MTLRTLCVYNGSIRDYTSFSFVGSQQFYNSANPREALAPWGRSVRCWLMLRSPGVAVTRRCHVPLLLQSVGGSFQRTSVFHVGCMLGLAVNHQ